MGGDKPKREDSDQELHTTFKRLRVDPDRYECVRALQNNITLLQWLRHYIIQMSIYELFL